MRIHMSCWLDAVKRLTLPALATAAMALGASQARAQGTVLTGCYVPGSGTVYRIKAAGLPDACRSTQHVEFTWNLQGPAGPQGPEGPVGPQGPAGPAGGIDARGVSIAVSSSEPIPPGQTRLVGAGCPSGSIATGGGGFAANVNGLMHLLSSAPTGVFGFPTGWAVNFENTTSIASVATAYAVCVPVQ